ncbi:hypothetical protein D3C80_1965600 [compost metagenome]
MFAVGQRFLQLKPILRQGDGRFAGEQPFLALAQTINVTTEALGQIFGTGVAIVPVGKRNAAANADFDTAALLLEHFTHQQQGG